MVPWVVYVALPAAPIFISIAPLNIEVTICIFGRAPPGIGGTRPIKKRRRINIGGFGPRVPSLAVIK